MTNKLRDKISGYTSLLESIKTSRAAMAFAEEQAREVLASTADIIKANHEKMIAHTNRQDLRPVLKVQQHKDKTYFISFNDQLYLYGFRKGWEKLDDDMPRFFWKEKDGEEHYVTSLHSALAHILLTFCQKDKINASLD